MKACVFVLLLAVLKIHHGITQNPIFFSFLPNPLKWELFWSTNPHSLFWAALCLSSNLDSLFATSDNCGGTFLQSQPFVGMGQTFLSGLMP